jgi:hypothetical protein
MARQMLWNLSNARKFEYLFEFYGFDLGTPRFPKRGENRGVREHVARVLSFVTSFVAFLWLCIFPVHSHNFFAPCPPPGVLGGDD